MMLRRHTADPITTRRQPGDVLLVTSTGGHLTQLLTLRPWWEQRSRTWVTFDDEDAASRLDGEQVVAAHHPTTRNIPNLLRNTRLATHMLMRQRPGLVVSTGAGVALPFFVLARLLGIPSVYIEVCDRLETASLTGRICYRLATLFLVQWPQQKALYPHAEVVGVLI